MKRQILFIMALTFSAMAMAQTKPTIGVQAGISNSSIKGDAASSFNDLLDYADGYITTNSKNGFYAGINATIPLSETISVQPGLQFTQKGYEMKGEMAIKGAEFLSPNAKATLTSNYIDVPVLLKANLNGLELFAGPQVSYLASADLKTTASVVGFNLYKNTFDATEQLNRWDAGIKAGVGYQFENGLKLDAAYDMGVMKSDANQTMDAYNPSLQVGIGFRF